MYAPRLVVGSELLLGQILPQRLHDEAQAFPERRQDLRSFANVWWTSDTPKVWIWNTYTYFDIFSCVLVIQLTTYIYNYIYIL